MPTTKIYSRTRELSVISKIIVTFITVVLVVVVLFVITYFSRARIFRDPKFAVKFWLILGMISLVGGFVYLFLRRFALEIQIDPILKKITVNYMTLLGTRHSAEISIGNFDYAVSRGKTAVQEKTITLKIFKGKQRIVSIEDDEYAWPLETLEQIISDFDEFKNPQAS